MALSLCLEADQKPSCSYESDDNPYRKQVKDTRAWGQEEHRKVLELEGKVKMLEAQAEGTWDYEQTEAQPSPEQIESLAELKGRTSASRKTLVESLGEEYVMETFDVKDSPFRKLLEQNPAYVSRTNYADTPYLEAEKIVQEEKFFTDYGRSPVDIKDKIKGELEKELRAEITKEFQDKIKNKEDIPKDLSGVKDEGSTKEEDKPFKPTPLGDVFSIQ